MQSFLGVDVSKAKLDVALMLANDKFKSKVFSNDIPGFVALVSWLHSQLPDGLVSLHICMESTGSHHEARATLLHSMPGLGEKTMPQLLAYIGRPERFRSVKAVIAHASLTPMIRQSGTSLDKRRGTHPLGHQALKAAAVLPGDGGGALQPAGGCVLEQAARRRASRASRAR